MQSWTKVVGDAILDKMTPDALACHLRSVIDNHLSRSHRGSLR